MDWLTIVVALVTLILAYVFYGAYKDRKYFEDRGILYAGNGSVSLLTNWMKGITIYDSVINMYNKCKDKNAKVLGSKDFGMNSYMILDQEWIKHVLVKDFDHFANRRQFQTPKNDILFDKMLITITGEKWKTLRSKLSPTFTTGKIKKMYSIFDQSGKKFIKYIESRMALEGEIDLTEAYSKLTMDIIASATCAMNSQAFDDPDNPSIFEQMGKSLQFNFGGKAIVKIIFMVLFPKLADILGLSFFPMNVQRFFSDAIKTSINQRKNGEKRDDFIQLMLEAREGQLKLEESELDTFEKDAIVKNLKNEDKMSDLLDDDGIVSNCVLFILAGFDTTQSLLLFAAYALALNQDVQEKLREEVNDVLERNDGEFTYDGLQKMTYLDMVINGEFYKKCVETLRFYPPAGVTDRGCVEDYTLPGTDIHIKKGDGIIIPILGLHHDPEFFPEPEKFDPERFSLANKSKISPYVFLPFGQGPRNCIGMRFALTDVKLAIAKMVHNFNIEPSAKTTIPMEYANSGSLKPKNGMWLALNSRH